jgi:SAM-dependent methyltransferase
MKTIKKCRICRSDGIIEFLDLGKHPLANSLLKSLDEKEKFYPLSLSWCPDCSLVQLNQTMEPTDLFSDYIWITGTSQSTKEYAKKFYEEIINKINDLDKGYVLEIGSNDGTFLCTFVKNGYDVLGVDPAQNIVNIAKANDIPTICGFFGMKLARKITEKFGQAKVIIARNVLPHVANLHSVIEGLYNCLEKDGLLVIEFHYAKVILQGLHYDSIYHEHLHYFTLKSIEELLNRYNLYVTDIKESKISGGSLVLFIRKNKVELPIVQHYRDKEKGLKVNDFSNWEEFARRVSLHKQQLLKILSKTKKPIIGYGASARSSTMLNYCGIDTKYISMIADDNPLKHKKFTAGTHIPIDSPDKAIKTKPRSVFILAWNFSDEIIETLKEKFKYNGKCIIPLPNNPRIEVI